MTDRANKTGFRVLYSGSPDVPSKFERWAKCARSLHSEGAPEVTGFKVVTSPDKSRFLLVTFSGKREAGRTNCHSYAARKLEALKGVLEKDDAVFGKYICGTNPQKEILDAATNIVAGGIKAAPQKISEGLRNIAIRTGDILIWKNDDGTISHSSIFDRQENDTWIMDEKMGGQPPKKRTLQEVAREMYDVGVCEDAELEFEWGLSGGCYSHVELRRPIKKKVK